MAVPVQPGVSSQARVATPAEINYAKMNPGTPQQATQQATPGALRPMGAPQVMAGPPPPQVMAPMGTPGKPMQYQSRGARMRNAGRQQAAHTGGNFGGLAGTPVQYFDHGGLVKPYKPKKK